MTTQWQARRYWILCVLFGAGVIAFAVWFGGVIPTKTCSGPLPDGVSSLVAFQLARTPGEIEAIFGAPGSPCRAEMILAMDKANTVDLVGFIVTYSAFLVFFFLALLRGGAGPWARVGLIAVIVAALFDVLETWTQLRITSELPGSAASLTLLEIGSRGKYLGLAVACASAGFAMLPHAGLFRRMAGAACIAGGIMVLYGLAVPAARATLSTGNAIAWVVMLLTALAGALLPSAGDTGAAPAS